MKKKLLNIQDVTAENILNLDKVRFTFLPGMDNFPLVVSPNFQGQDLPGWVKNNQQLLADKVSHHGALLFRGFNIDTLEKFNAFTNCFDMPTLEYKQRTSPRYEVAKNIYHSTSYPADQSINMHSENSYAKNWAMKLAFCCIVPPEEQGETPIADNRMVLKKLSAETKQKFLSKGVKYVRNISKWVGLSWEEVFQTDDKLVVEAECRNNGMVYNWDDDDRLVLTWNNGAIYKHPVTQEEIWFNHAFFFNKHSYSEDVLAALTDDELPFNTYYGDGTEISRSDIEEIKAAYEKATVKFAWEKGDVLFLDNMLTSHGRSPYRGERKIVVSMF